MKCSNLRECLAVRCVAALLTGSALAAPVAVNDHSFEDVTVAGTMSYNLVELDPAWTNWTWSVNGSVYFVGLYNPSGLGAETITGVDGVNIVASYFNDGPATTELSQVIGPLPGAGAYTLVVSVGRDTASTPSDFSFDLNTTDRIGLGLSPLARYDGAAAELTAVGDLNDFSVSYDIPIASPLIGPGTDFAVILRQEQAGGSGLQHALFDNVRLYRIPPPAGTLVTVR